LVTNRWTMTEIRKRIEKAISDGGQITGSPKAFEKLSQMGVKVDDWATITPWEDYVEQLFGNGKKIEALKQVQRLPPLPDIHVPAAVQMYREIIKCTAFGLDGAAITLSCLLAEYFLKFAIFKVEMGGFKRYDPEKWDELENLEFGRAIGRAAKNGLLSKLQKKQLAIFREEVRNPYLHYNIRRITAGLVLKGVERVRLETGESEIVDLAAHSDPTVQPGAKKFADAQQLIPVFRFVNGLVSDLWDKITHLQDEPR